MQDGSPTDRDASSGHDDLVDDPITDDSLDTAPADGSAAGGDEDARDGWDGQPSGSQSGGGGGDGGDGRDGDGGGDGDDDDWPTPLSGPGGPNFSAQ